MNKLYYYNDHCIDCLRKMSGKDYFKVHDDLWKSVCKPKDMLCFLCFENRLNRNLDLKDFSNLKMAFTDERLEGKSPQEFRYISYCNWKILNG
jgi:hypothetical protein